LLCLVAATSACGGEIGHPAAGEDAPAALAAAGADFAVLRGGRPFNVVVVTLDTTRADRIGAYGFPQAATPTIDALATGGILFRNAYSPVPLTLPAHVSLFTGAYPFDHGVRDNTGFAVPEEVVTLAEVLQQNDFRTAAFVSSYVLAPHWGLAQGFEVYEDGLDAEARRVTVMNDAQRPANEVVDDALAWLERRAEGPFFLWVHLYDAHTPYAPPEPFASRYTADPYAGEIAFMDSQLARLMDRLEDNGLAQSTFTVVAGDHGESLGEHGELEHGFFVYEAATRVPLIVRTPFDALAGIEQDVPVSLIDVMPTVLAMNGIAIPPDNRGLSLVPWFDPRTEAPARVVYSESLYARLHYGWGELAAVQDGRYKLIDSPDPELYDVAADPLESVDLLADRPGEHDRLDETLEELLDAARARDAGVAVDAGARSTLESLGYISAPAARGGADGARASPRSMIEVYNLSLRARDLMGRGDLDAAARLYDQILDRDPEVLIAYERLAEIYMQQGRFAEAAETFSFAVPLRPDWHDIYVKLAEAQMALGQPQRAEQTLLGGLQLAPPHPATYCLLGYINEREPDHAAALQHYEKCRELDPGSPEPLVYMARVHLQTGDLAAAEARAREALALDARAAGAHFVLAQAHSRRGNPPGALDEYLAEIDSSPNDPEAHFGAAMIYGETGRRADERRHLEHILQVAPDHALAALFLGNLLLEAGEEYARAVELVSDAVQQPLSREDLAAGYFILSNLHERLGNTELAQQYLRRAQELR
jgi:arylsulfatase A-like enzyme/Tfp pilus assembly protein PilF